MSTDDVDKGVEILMAAPLVAENDRLRAAAADFNRLRQEAQSEARILRAEVERLREGTSLALRREAAIEKRCALAVSQRDRLRAVLAETPENVAAIHAKLGRSLNWNEVIATVLADQRARAGEP